MSVHRDKTSKGTNAPNARSIAARVLERVQKDQAFAAAALDAELSRHPQLDERDRALATQLVYGCLRTKTALLARLEQFAPRGLAKGDACVLSHLMVAAYQILKLDRVPDFAAVDAAVGAIREARGKRVAGFANAVLRKLAASGEKLDSAAAVLGGAPAWLVELLRSTAGVEEALALLGTDESPPLSLRLRAEVRMPSWLSDAERGRASPLARILRGHGDLRLKEGYAEGAFVVQEEGAQVVALAVGVRSGERVLDACAGRGQKTTLFAEQLQGSGELWATDIYPAKLRALSEEFGRLGLPEPSMAAVDWTVGAGSVPSDFDRVLVDAPCTGVGTLRRRPEIAQRLAASDPARLAQLAERILRAAARRARIGGRVVFSVCSILPKECEGVVERVRDLLEPVPFDVPLLEHVILPGSTSVRLLPGRHGTDGYFVASFVRRAAAGSEP